jgi:integrase
LFLAHTGLRAEELGGSRHRGRLALGLLDFSEPVDTTSFYKNVLRPALAAVGLPASRPARPVTDTEPAQPATKGVRLHDLRHTAATLWLTNGVHSIQVVEWLGHSSYVLTLTTYADYIPDVEAENPLPEPAAAAPDTNVVNLFG